MKWFYAGENVHRLRVAIQASNIIYLKSFGDITVLSQVIIISTND